MDGDCPDRRPPAFAAETRPGGDRSTAAEVRLGRTGAGSGPRKPAMATHAAS